MNLHRLHVTRITTAFAAAFLALVSLPASTPHLIRPSLQVVPPRGRSHDLEVMGEVVCCSHSCFFLSKAGVCKTTVQLTSPHRMAGEWQRGRLVPAPVPLRLRLWLRFYLHLVDRRAPHLGSSRQSLSARPSCLDGLGERGVVCGQGLVQHSSICALAARARRLRRCTAAILPPPRCSCLRPLATHLSTVYPLARGLASAHDDKKNQKAPTCKSSWPKWHAWGADTNELP